MDCEGGGGVAGGGVASTTITNGIVLLTGVDAFIEDAWGGSGKLIWSLEVGVPGGRRCEVFSSSSD